MLFYYVAINFQKAGHILSATYPQMYVLHGVKHLISLFFAWVVNIPTIITLTNKNKII